MSKHTPGPWKTEINTSVHRPCVRCSNEETWEVSASSVGDSTANARLIAAAPEMLEALKLALTLNGNPRRDCEDEAEWKKIMGNINALIARIEEE